MTWVTTYFFKVRDVNNSLLALFMLLLHALMAVALKIRDVWGHPLSTYAKFSEELSFLTPLICTRTCAYQGVRNFSFSENFAYVLYGCPLIMTKSWTIIMDILNEQKFWKLITRELHPSFSYNLTAVNKI